MQILPRQGKCGAFLFVLPENRIDALIRQPDIELDIRSETFAEASGHFVAVTIPVDGNTSFLRSQFRQARNRKCKYIVSGILRRAYFLELAGSGCPVPFPSKRHGNSFPGSPGGKKRYGKQQCERDETFHNVLLIFAGYDFSSDRSGIQSVPG